VFGYLVGRVLIVLVLLPGYFRGEFFTAYALIEKRFGEKMRSVAASTFLITRAIAEGVRVSAIALVLSVVLAPRKICGRPGNRLDHLLHARRRDESRHLDRRRATDTLSDWQHGNAVRSLAPYSGG